MDRRTAYDAGRRPRQRKNPGCRHPGFVAFRL